MTHLEELVLRDNPALHEAFAAWDALQAVPSYVTRYARGQNRIVERLRRGETVEVQVMANGRCCAIRPEQWEGIVLGFSCLVEGKVEPGYHGLLLDRDQLWDWTEQLIERA